MLVQSTKAHICRFGIISPGCWARNKIRSNEVNVKRERLTQIVLVIVGLLNLALIYFLYMDLRHSSWLLERKNEVEPMFLSFFIPAGVFLSRAQLTVRGGTEG